MPFIFFREIVRGRDATKKPLVLLQHFRGLLQFRAKHKGAVGVNEPVLSGN